LCEYRKTVIGEQFRAGVARFFISITFFLKKINICFEKWIKYFYKTIDKIIVNVYNSFENQMK
jgi:hypothetical protein